MVRKLLEKQRVIPVLTLENIDDGYFIARLLKRYDFKLLEITLRNPFALDIAKGLQQEFSDLKIGVGTVTSIQKMSLVTDEDFAFAVSPGFDPAMVNMADIANLPFLPGINTMTEAMNALSYGLKFLKLFPAEQSGGIEYLKYFNAVMPELTFCPTGGISLTNISNYLDQKNVACVGCSDIAPQSLIKARDESGLKERIKAYQEYNG